MIDFFCDEGVDYSFSPELVPFLENVLQSEKVPIPCNIILTNDEPVRKLNRDFRGKDQTTDVLSFPWEEEDFLGEIYISLPQLLRQAPEYGATLEEELQRVSLHGLLHLLGYDHMEEQEKEEMQTLEENYLKRSIY